MTYRSQTMLRTIFAMLLILTAVTTCTTSPRTRTVSHPFDMAWEDRAIFREGLIDAEQAVLDDLPGATVYRMDLQIPDDFLLLQGREQVRYTNQENEPLNEVYFRLFPNVVGGETTVSAVKVDDQDVEPVYELQNSAVRVPLAAALQPGEQAVIQMDFEVRVPR
ncbi:MAG: hypothetical protein PVJ86_14105, partial [Phycisphaerales bacterium]